jgi:hypothetical protein
MTRDSDDEALRWEGDDDPTLAPGWKTVGQPVPLQDPSEEDEPSTEADGARQPGSAELVLLGVLGGVYLIYSIGWLISATVAPPEFVDPVAQFMYSLGRWLAVAAPALWFATVLWLAAEHRRARLLWLLAGAVLLVPVPFLLRG